MRLCCLVLGVLIAVTASLRADAPAATTVAAPLEARITPASTSVTPLAPVSRRDQIQAATDNAVQSLRQQVRAVRINRDLSIGQLVDKVQGEHELVRTLARAQQIGGPRWLDDQTCQVRLEIAGSSVAETLRQIVKDSGDKTPVTLEQLNTRLGDLEKRRFSADGTSTSGESAAMVRPIRESDGWAGVSDENRKAAVCAARADAVSKAMERIGAVGLAPGSTVKDALRVKPVGDAVSGWLSKRPVTGLEFGPDMNVRLGLSAPVDELCETFKTAASAQKDVAVPGDAAGWNAVRQGIASRLGQITGQAGATMTGTKVVSAVQLPTAPPEWAQQQRDVEGSGKAKNKLKAARAAEADALARLKSQVETLPLDSGLTIAEAQKRDPRFKKAVDRALDQAKTFKVDYEDDGKISAARVKVSLDLRELWEEIRALP